MSRHPITNAQYELFDPSHVRKRAPGAGDRHPVVYVSSVEAIKFCQWLSSTRNDGDTVCRLKRNGSMRPAARTAANIHGEITTDAAISQISPIETRFSPGAIARSTMAMPESSPVGAFPLGASPFGMEDMAGNVWEWCLRLSGSRIEAPQESTHAEQSLEPNGSIGVAVGSRASTACARRPAAPTCRTIPATISGFESSANANCSRFAHLRRVGLASIASK